MRKEEKKLRNEWNAKDLRGKRRKEEEQEGRKRKEKEERKIMEKDGRGKRGMVVSGYSQLV